MRATSPLLDRVVGWFEVPKPNGTGVHVRCPCHDDRKQSLHVSPGRAQNVVIFCHAGCKTKEILERVGKTEADLFEPGANTRPAILTFNADEPSTIRTFYDYPDDTGTLLYQNVRKQFADGSKTFFMRRPDEGGGGWINSLGDIRRVIYRLPEVLKAIAADKPILYLEGEKDVDRARSLDIPATTHAGGAKAFRPGYAEQLAGADVVLLPDHDQPGYQMAHTAYPAFRDKATSVNVLQLVGLPEKSDFSDYVDAIGEASAADLRAYRDDDRLPTSGPYLQFITPEQLAELAGVPTSDESTQSAQDDDGIVWSLFSDIVEEPVSWIWDDYIAAGKFHLFGGIQGDGKSTIAADIAARLSSGQRMPDNLPVAPHKVGFLISEDGVADTVLPRLRIHRADLGNIAWIEGSRGASGTQPLSLAADLEHLERFIRREQIEVLFIDALSDFLGSVKQNDNAEVRSVLTPLAQMAVRTRCAIIGIVHLGKSTASARRAIERVLGSGAFTQVARIVWAIGVDDENETKRYFGQVKNNIAPEPATLCWHRDRDQPISWGGMATHSIKAVMSGYAKKTTKTEQAQTFLAELLKDGPVPAQIVFTEAASAGLGESAVYDASRALGVLKNKEAKKGGQTFWSLPIPPNQAERDT